MYSYNTATTSTSTVCTVGTAFGVYMPSTLPQELQLTTQIPSTSTVQEVHTAWEVINNANHVINEAESVKL